MLMQVTNEVELVKKVIEAISYDVDKNTELNRNRKQEAEKMMQEHIGGMKLDIKNIQESHNVDHKQLVKFST